jgi:hypothetical protein
VYRQPSNNAGGGPGTGGGPSGKSGGGASGGSGYKPHGSYLHTNSNNASNSNDGGGSGANKARGASGHTQHGANQMNKTFMNPKRSQSTAQQQQNNLALQQKSIESGVSISPIKHASQPANKPVVGNPLAAI